MPRKKTENNQINEQEQQLVVFGAEKEKEAADSNPEANDGIQEENAVPGTKALNSYFEKFRYFEKNIANYDTIMNYVFLVGRSLNNNGNDPDAVNLKEDFDVFSRRVKKLSMDVSKAVTTAVNETGDRNAATGAGVNANNEEFNAIRTEFNKLSNRLETFMRSKPANPAVANVIKRTGKIIGDGEPAAGRSATRHGENAAFSASTGPNRKERQAFFEVYTDYLRTMVKVSKNKIVVDDDDRSTPEQKLNKYMDRIKNCNAGKNPDSIFYIDFKDFPRPQSEEDFNSLSTEEGLGSFLKKVDEFLIQNHESIDADKLGNMTGYVKDDEKYFRNINMQEEYLKEILNVINNDNMAWDVRKMYLRNVCNAGFKNGLPERYNVETFLDDRKSFSNQLKTDVEKKKSARRWLSEVGKHIARENKYDSKRENAIVMTHAMYATGKDNLETLPQIIGVLEAGKKILNTEVVVSMKMAYMRDMLEQLHNVKDIKLVPGVERSNPRRLLEKLDEATETYFKTMEMGNSLMTWSDDEIQSIGAVIDVVCAIKPADKTKLCLRMNLDVNKKGEYSIGGDIPLVTKSASEMKKTEKEVLDADPALMKSSPEYKALREATEKFQKKTADFLKARNTKGKLSDEQIMELLSMADNAQKCADEYTTYKFGDLGKKAPNKREMRRLNAAVTVSATADNIKRYVREYTLKKTLPDGPKAALDAVEKQFFAKADPTTEDLASMVYIQAMRDEFEKKPDDFSAEKMLKYSKMKENVLAIMGNNDFKKIIKDMPKNLTGADAKNHVYQEMKNKANNTLNKTNENKKTMGPTLK